MKHMKHMIGCVAMIAVVAVVFLGGNIPSWLPFILVLGCPLMMIAMMFMMRGDHNHVELDDSELDDAHRAGRAGRR